MKKLTLFLLATLFSALSFAALNPYAYGLSSSLDGTTLTVNYSLNAPATAVSVVIMDGETEVKTITCDGITKGSHSVDISTLDLPTSKSLTWKVVVTGAAVTDVECTNDISGTTTKYKFYRPQGVAVDNNPESDFFGRIYIALPRGGYDHTKGVVVFDPVHKVLSNSGITATGVALASDDTYGMHRIAVNPTNGKVYYAKSETSTAIYELTPDATNILSDGGTAKNVISGMSTITNANSLCFDKNGAMYVLGNAGYASATDTYTGKIYKIENGTISEFTKEYYRWASKDNSIVSDERGGFWVAQQRTNFDGCDVLAHVNSNGTRDYKITSTVNNTLLPTKKSGSTTNASYRGQVAHYLIDGNNGILAFGGGGKVSIFKVTYAADEVPTLTAWKTISLKSTSWKANVDGLAFDYAGNLIVMSATDERFGHYALPKDNNTCVTPCASKYAFELEEVVANVYTLTTSVVGEGTVDGNAGSYVEGTTVTLTATPAAHYDFLNWTYGSETSTANPLTITVNSDMTVTANFQEHTKYTITAQAADNTMGYVTGGNTYYAGETVTLKAVANSTYCFVNWSDGNTDATRTFTATADVTLTANFAKASSRAWAYDLKMVEDGDKYKFSFTATTAANATLLFLDKEGNELYAAHNVGAVAAGANTVSIEKAYFTQVKDVYWSVKMDGEAINSVAEITDQSRNIYDFYNMQGVVVDNDPNSEKFGEIYIEMAKSGTTNGKAQTLGLFLLNQNLDVLNTDPNVGIQPTMPSGYALNGTNYTFQRLNIDPTTGKLAFSYGISGKPAVFAIDRENMTGSVTNLLDGITGLTKTVAHCFDEDGALYVMDIVSYKGTIYKIKDGVKSTFSAATGKYAADNITMTSDGRGGLWVAQNRGQIDACYQLAHVNSEGVTDWSIYDDQGGGTSSTGFTGYSTRGALAYDAERHILAQGRNSTVEVFQVAYDATTGVPTLTKIATTPQVNKANIDGLAFDYAGDLYMVNSGTEKFYKYTLPTAENICTVSAPESQAIIKEVRYIVTVNTVGNGTATGAGEYVAGETATFEASPAAHHKFVNWTYGSETSTNNPLELVVNSDITVTANFAPVQYTLIAPTNDEDKGTVTGAGAYNYGTEVTLTATPKEGYKLLYWSDRSTENPRTITMTKNEAISAYFVKEYDEEPTFKIEKIWENAQVPAATGDGYQAVGWDQKIYMQNKTAGKIQVFSNGTNAATDYATSNTSGQQIAVDEAGNLIVFNATFSTANPNAILIYQKGSTEGKAVSFTLKAPARCDFFSASGDIYSASGGYVYFYCAGKTVINRLKITNGAATTFDVTTDVVGEAVYSSPQNTNYVMVDIFGNLVAHARSNAINAINVYTNESKAFTLPSIKMGTLGGCSFELGGKELWAYHAGASNYSSEWNIYNMTDSKFLSDDDFYAVDKSATTNYACNWLNVQVVDEYTAYIYQFCPKKAVALWKVTLERDDLQEFTVTATANDPAMGTVTGGDTYYKDATATLTATPYAGYRFVNWTKAGVEVSTNATYTFTVTEDVELVANFEALPEITYELNDGVWNKYGWTSKKDMYDAFVAEWKAYSGSTRGTIPYEDQFGIGKSNAGIPTTIQDSEPILEFMRQEKWEWLGQFLDALAIAQGKETMPTTAVKQMRFGLGNFFGEDNNQTGWLGAVDCSGDIASITAFAPYWGQTFPMPTQPTEEVVLNAPYKEGYEFDGWYANSDFSGAEVTVVDETTNGTLYANWLEHFYTRTVTPGHYGTICLPYASSSYSGAEFYEVSWLQKSGETPVNLYLDQLEEGAQLVAGKPYIFRATSTELTVTYTGAAVDDPIPGENGLTGSFDPIHAGGVLTGNYVVAQTKFWTATATAYAAENRAYIDKDNVPDKEQKQIPGRRRVVLGTSGENAESGFEDIIAPESKVIKVIENGQLIIIRDGEKYNVQGQKL